MRSELKLAPFAMHDGKCVEMQTGEGKTLAAAVVVSLRALTGLGVLVLTFNDYLAKRDAEWMGPLYRFLGLTVGYVVQGLSGEEKRSAYGCDITYVTAKEAGFDFLRDQLCGTPELSVQRGFHFALVDEADSILIDEARIPLVIATEAEKDETDLFQIVELIRPLKKGFHYEVKSNGRNISLTDAGVRLIERQLGVAELHNEASMHLLARINLALQAEVLLQRDIDYLVRNDTIELIDEFTGRVAENRKWPGGLQAALEAKEGVKAVETMRTATFPKDGIDLETEGPKAPSSTWTFLINDNPRGSVLNRIIQSLKGRMKESNRDTDE